MVKPAFFYKVKFHFLGQDDERNLSHHHWEKDYKDPDPLLARQEAFEAFEDFLEHLRINGKIKKNKVGNDEIISPSGIPPEPELDYIENEDDLIAATKAYSEFSKYREELVLLLVIADDELLEELGYGDSFIKLHSVTSSGVDAEVLIENLELIELVLYEKSGIDIEEYKTTVKHFGEHYEDMGEAEDAAIYHILPTPFQWTTREQYLKEKIEEGISDKDELTWEEIISRGESNSLELKSSLVYNFSEHSGNHLPLYNNARTLCGFMNSNGGILVIGVSDEGAVQGIEKDLELLKSKDKIRLKVDDMIAGYFGNAYTPLLDIEFAEIDQKEVLIIGVEPSATPVFLKNYNPVSRKTTKHFFVRRTASTTELKDVEEIIHYVFNHPYKR